MLHGTPVLEEQRRRGSADDKSGTRTMIARWKSLGVASALAAVMPFAPSAWAQCTTTLASGSFDANAAWSASPTFNASSAGTVTLTVTGGAGGQASMTIDNGASVSVSYPGSVSQSVAAGTHSVLAGDGGVAHAAGRYAITFSGASCVSGTLSPSTTAQQAQNQSAAVQNGQTGLANVLGFVLLQARVLLHNTVWHSGHMLDPYIVREMITLPGVRESFAFGHMGSADLTSYAIAALAMSHAGKNPYYHGFRNAVEKGDIKAAAKAAWMSMGIRISDAPFHSSKDARQARPSVMRLEDEEREQAEALRELQIRSGGALDRERIVELSMQLARTQDTLKLTRLNARIAVPAAGGMPSVELSPAPAAAPKSLSFDTRNVRDACLPDADDCRPLNPSRWNAWLEGRAMGSSDSLLQNNALGFLGFGGVGYQATPWLMTGLSVGAETFRTAYTSGAGSTTLGLSVVPYAGIRLDQNVQAAAFVGFTSIAYNTSPASGVAAQFAAQRYMVGGALTGTWHEGFWRFQPSLQATYATENQNAYTDSAGTPVPGQTVFYGRIGAGPEIGYTFIGGSGTWALEPFASAKINLNIASNTLAVVNNAPVVVRPGTLGSGSLGGGINLNVSGGPSLRFQGSYDSIGVTGLDVWSALIRGSFSF